MQQDCKNVKEATERFQAGGKGQKVTAELHFRNGSSVNTDLGERLKPSGHVSFHKNLHVVCQCVSLRPFS